MGAYRTPGKVGSKSAAGDFSNAMNEKEDFKKGGKVTKKVMSKAARPARQSGGRVMSSAASGTPRAKASHY
jgi:hypothetical protein